MATTILSVSPQPTTIKVGQEVQIAITTEATSYNVALSPETGVLTYTDNRKTLTGTGIGECTITVTATADDKEEATVEWTANVVSLNAANIEFGDPTEILENTYHYDDTLPTSTNGTIAYKTGNNTDDPLIKLVFDGDSNRWRVIGVKMVTFNSNGESYDLYFLASEGLLRETLNGIDLETVIIDLIDTLFIQESPNMTSTIQTLFAETINPLVQEQLDNIPQLVQNAVDEQTEQIIEDKIVEQLSEKFGDIINEKVKEEILNYNYGYIQPYHNDSVPTWTGIIVAENMNVYGYDMMNYFVRRINSCGIEEYWRSNDIDMPPMNANTNDDPLTKLFDKIEPFKSMDRMIIPLSELENISGDAIYGSEVFERLASQSVDKTHKFWNGDYIGNLSNSGTLSSQNWNWVVPIKKCYYIDIIIYYNNDGGAISSSNMNNVYLLKAVGSEPFKIDLKEYFPNMDSFTIDSFVCEQIGYKRFEVDYLSEQGKALVTSQLHPTFLNYYDLQLNLLDTPLELDYRYLGAFHDSFITDNVPLGINTSGRRFISRPFANASNNIAHTTTYFDNNTWHVYGQNPSTGTNLAPVDVNVLCLEHLLIDIESGWHNRARKSWTRGASKWGYNVGYFYSSGSSATFETGNTFMSRNKTCCMMNTKAMIFNYRGIERFLYDVTLGTRCNNNIIYRHYPHTHRYKETLTSVDNAQEWVSTGITQQIASDDNWSKHLGNAIDVFINPATDSRYGQYSNLPYFNNTFRINFDSGDTIFYYMNCVARWRVVGSASWDSLSRSYI